MKLININFRKTMVNLFFMTSTIVLIMIYLSVHGKEFDWFWQAKNSVKELSLYPLISLGVGGFGTIVAGNMMQYSTRNNLASPFTMGILPAASLAAVTLRLINIVSLWLTLGLGIIYSIIILSIVVFTSYQNEKSNMIVVGLAIGMVIMGLNFLLAMNLPDSNLVFRWFASGKTNFTLRRIRVFVPFVIGFSLVGIILQKYITYYKRSPIKALTLGINIKWLVYISYVCVAIIAVGTVLLIGEIAFVGMAIPNITRILFKTDSMILNILFGFFITFPLLIISLIIANVYIYNFQLLVTVICAPIFIGALIIRRLYEK